MTLLKRLSIGAAALLVIGVVSPVLSQTSGTGQQASPMYDLKTETTIKGTVESVETVAAMGRGRGAAGGTHLVVKTEKEAIAVHVGPTAYLRMTIYRGCKRTVSSSVISTARVADNPVASGERSATMIQREFPSCL